MRNVKLVMAQMKIIVYHTIIKHIILIKNIFVNYRVEMESMTMVMEGAMIVIQVVKLATMVRIVLHVNQVIINVKVNHFVMRI